MASSRCVGLWLQASCYSLSCVVWREARWRRTMIKIMIISRLRHLFTFLVFSENWRFLRNFLVQRHWKHPCWDSYVHTPLKKIRKENFEFLFTTEPLPPKLRCLLSPWLSLYSTSCIPVINCWPIRRMKPIRVYSCSYGPSQTPITRPGVGGAWHSQVHKAAVVFFLGVRN